MRLIAYCRVSTDEQALSGLGLDAQERTLRRELEHRGWELAELVRDEGHSGSTLERPGIKRALRAIARGQADGLVVAKLDRLSRSTIDFPQLVEWFVDVEATLVALDLQIDTSTASGRLVANTLINLAEWERGQAAERTRAALASLRARGKPTGRPAVADRPELAARIRAMREEGYSLQGIANVLNAEGVATTRGAAAWRPSSVQSAAGYRRRPPRRRPAALPAVRRKGRTG